MTLHRVYVSNDILQLAKEGSTIRLPEDAIHRLVRVLRITSTTEVELFDGRGLLVKGLISPDKSDPEFHVNSVEQKHHKGVKLCLAQAMIKQEKMEEVVQQGTQIGIHQFLFFVGKHSIVKKTERTAAQFERLERIATDASRQSERSEVPEIIGPLSFSEMITSIDQDRLYLFVGEPRGAPKIVEQLQKIDWKSVREIILVVGPEGGLHSSEIETLQSIGACLVNYSPNIIRTETAGLVGMSIIQSFSE